VEDVNTMLYLTQEKLRMQDGSLALLRNAWMLGPKRKGPNILVWRDPSSPESSSFFRDPRTRVVSSGVSPQRLFGEEQTADESGAAKHDGQKEGRTKWPLLRVGTKTVAQQLRLVPSGQHEAEVSAPMLQSIESGIAAAFQMAAAAGPLCADPLWGVAFKLEVALAADAEAFDVNSLESWKGLDFRENVFGPLSGQVQPRFSLFFGVMLCA
jgi:hypothetical protein